MGWVLMQDDYGNIEEVWVDDPERPAFTKEEEAEYYAALAELDEVGR